MTTVLCISIPLILSLSAFLYILSSKYLLLFKFLITHFYLVGSVFLIIYFKHFIFIELFSLNSNFYNPFEIFSINEVSVDSLVNFLFDFWFLMCISFIFLKSYSHENKDQISSLKCGIEFTHFFHQMHLSLVPLLTALYN